MKKIKSLKDEYRNSNLYKCIEPWETPEEAEGFFLTPFNQKETGLAMWISLRCVENKGIIIKHYYQEYDSADVCKKMKKYKE